MHYKVFHLFKLSVKAREPLWCGQFTIKSVRRAFDFSELDKKHPIYNANKIGFGKFKVNTLNSRTKTEYVALESKHSYILLKNWLKKELGT